MHALGFCSTEWFGTPDAAYGIETFCFVVFYLYVYGGAVIDEYVFRTGP